jgi:hypothetical protein
MPKPQRLTSRNAPKATPMAGAIPRTEGFAPEVIASWPDPSLAGVAEPELAFAFAFLCLACAFHGKPSNLSVEKEAQHWRLGNGCQ